MQSVSSVQRCDGYRYMRSAGADSDLCQAIATNNAVIKAGEAVDVHTYIFVPCIVCKEAFPVHQLCVNVYSRYS